MLFALIIAAIVGLITGALARLALPGRDPMSLLQTMLVGIAGSVIATLIVWLITGGRQGAGWFLGFVVSVLIVYAIRRSRGGDLTHPGDPARGRAHRA
jgi:uncharacterized membrane protein YeaQ/YmgE (transglycosylase-associated protein family)